jgi:hypothetical protein
MDVCETTQCHICLGNSDVLQAAGRLLQLIQRETQRILMQQLQTTVYFYQTFVFSSLVSVYLSSIYTKPSNKDRRLHFYAHKFFFSNVTTCPLWTSRSPLPVVAKCNRLLKLGRPWGAVTLSRWGGWWYMDMKYVPGGTLNLSSTKLPRPWSLWESFPSRKNPHVRTGNRTRDLMISSQKLWPLDHETGLYAHKLWNIIRHESKEENKSISRNVELKRMRREIAENVHNIKDLRTVMTSYIKIVYIIYYCPSGVSKKFPARTKDFNVEISPMLSPVERFSTSSDCVQTYCSTILLN